MSNVVENRVVQMGFDNSAFLKGISSSLSGLKSLTSALQSVSGSKYFDNMESSMGDVSKGISSLSERFSTWGIIGMTAVENITNKILNELCGALSKVENFLQVQSYTTGAISEGWGKYADMSQSVATIMSATTKSVDEVSEQMKRLMYFSDETSYSFTDMASNVSKFTSQGIDLDKAVIQMEGIATWAALAGQGANEASRAMYNLSQAMGAGAVKLIDWKSIQNANMETLQFKNLVLELAADAEKTNGTLKKGANDVYKTLKGTEVTAQNFAQTLSEGWFDSSVLQAALEAYGNFSNELNTMYNTLNEIDGKEGYLTSEIVGQGGLLDQFSAGTLDWAEVMEKTGKTAEELAPMFASLTSEENKLGREAFAAGQECRTFAAAIDATADAASSKWMQIFETIFGNVEEATGKWSAFCEFLYDAFVYPLDKIAQGIKWFAEDTGFDTFFELFSKIGEVFLGMTEGANEMLSGVVKTALETMNKSADRLLRTINLLDVYGVFDSIVESFGNLKEAFLAIVSPIKAAFEMIFPKKSIAETTSGITNLVNKFKDLTESLKPNSEESFTLFKIFGNIFTVIKNGITIVKNFISSLSFLVDPLKKLGSILVDSIETFTKWAANVSTSAAEITDFKGIVKGVSDAISWLIDKVKELASGGIWNKVVDIATKVLEKVKSVFTKVKEYISGIDLSKINFGNLAKGVAALLAGGGILSIADSFKELKEKITSFKITDVFKDISEGITGFVDNIKGLFGSGSNKSIIEGITDFAIAIGVLSASLFVLSLLETEDIVRGLGAIAGMMGVLSGAAILLAKTIKPKQAASLTATGISMVAMASACLILSAAMIVLAGALELFILISRQDDAWVGLGLMAATLGAVALELGVLAKVCNGGNLLAASVAIAITAASLLILAAALEAFILITKQEETWEGFGLMAASLGSVAVVLGVLSKVCNGGALLAAAASILVVSASLLVLAAALEAFVLISKQGDDAIVGFALMAGMIVVLVAALMGLSVVGPIVLAASAAILIFSVACIGIAAALLVAVAAFDLFVVGIGLLGPAIALLGQGIGDAIAGLGEGISDAVKFVGEGIASAVSDIIASIGEGIGEGISAISEGITDFGESIKTVSVSVIDFGDALRSLKGIPWLEIAAGLITVGGGFKDLLDKAKGFDSFSAGVVEMASNITILCNASPQLLATAAAIDQITIAITDPSLQRATEKLAENLVNGFKRGVSGLISNVSYMMAQAVSTITSFYYNFQNAGYWTIMGLLSGINMNSWQVVNAMYNLGINAVAAYNQGTEIGSPSKKMKKAGYWTIMGLVNGIKENTHYVVDSMTGTAQAVLSTVSSMASQVQDLLDETSSPTITPVLDMSNIDRGLSSLGSSMSMGSVQYSASKASASFSASGTIQNGGISGGKTIVFNQNNYSPKSLSRIDIYRQTKNQLSAARGVV